MWVWVYICSSVIKRSFKIKTMRPAVNPRTICLYHTFANLRKEDILNEIRNKISIGALCLVFYLLLANTTTENTVLHSHTPVRDEDYYHYWADRTAINIPQSVTCADFTREWGWVSCSLCDSFFACLVLHESVEIEERQEFEPQLSEKLLTVVDCGVSTAPYGYCSCIVYWY